MIYQNNTDHFMLQWGKFCKVYYGKGAKAKAEKQCRAAYANGYKGK